MDSEEAIQFTELEGIDCMVQTFPLEKANDAYGRDPLVESSDSFANE
jgi:D-arabinose 1-dehydrogenase-like Zn-dependent alcohol dehydrogenase